jgi:hypothetical protein
LKTFSESIGRSLEWRQPTSRRQRYELLGKGEVIASLVFRSSFDTQATMETAHGSWTFKRTGFHHPRITVRPADSEKDAAVYTPGVWGAGTLRFADGETFLWRLLGLWRPEWGFSDSEERTLVTFKPWPGKTKLKDIFKAHMLVEIDALAASDKRLPLLAAFGLYLVLLHQQETAVVVPL